MHYFIADIESSGFCPIRNDVISLGLIVADQSLNKVDEIYLKFRPDIYKGVSGENVASHVHGFLLSEMVLFPDRRDSLIDLLMFLKKYKDKDNHPQPFLFHALKGFDYFFLEWCFRKENAEYSFYKVFDMKKIYSSIELARSLNYQGNKLSEWASRLNLKFNHHNALSDADMCLNVFKFILINNFNGNIDDMFNHLKRVKHDL
jgi:DNA polymerase III epsilon subunit-like protein